MIKKLETYLTWGLLCGSCLIILAMIGATKLCPDGDSNSQIVRFLIKNVTIQTVVEDGRWNYEYPFDENLLDNYLASINNIKKSLNNFCTNSFPGRETINSIVTRYKTGVMHYNIDTIPSIEDNEKYVSPYIDNVIEFQSELNSMGIPFFYVQTPSPASIDYYGNKKIEGDSLKIAERSFCFTSLLERSGIDVVCVAKDYSDNITFDVSSHWMPTDALECARIIVQKMADDYAFDIDYHVLDNQYFFDITSKYPEIANMIKNKFGYDFIVPCPIDNPHILRIYAEDEQITGNYDSVIFNPVKMWKMDGSAYHDAYTINNSLINSIYNDEAMCDKRVLIIGDSFNWPVGSYLSLACGDVTIIHNASFTGSLISYIKKMNPDIVIMVYNDAEFYEVYTEDAYYLK